MARTDSDRWCADRRCRASDLEARCGSACRAARPISSVTLAKPEAGLSHHFSGDSEHPVRFALVDTRGAKGVSAHIAVSPPTDSGPHFSSLRPAALLACRRAASTVVADLA